jgi:hypothetical protein
MIQKLGLSPKSYSIFNRLPKNSSLRRKGHLLHNPTTEQIKEIYGALLKKIRIQNWFIHDKASLYTDKSWPVRSIDTIDTIVISSTDSSQIDADKLYELDTSVENSITPGKPLPGIATHIFLNATGLVEKTADYMYILPHTPGVNARSISIMLQYVATGNNSLPAERIKSTLEKLLTSLCLEFKLNPYKAIKGQRETVLVKNKYLYWLTVFMKGRKTNLKTSPGPLVPLSALRESVAIKMQQKLLYAGVFDGQVDGKFTRSMAAALNKFQSSALKNLYLPIKIEKIKYDSIRSKANVGSSDSGRGA